jgi:hypothetical protein
MRAPSLSFRSELTTWRKQFVAQNDQSPLRRFVLEIIDRWLNHGSVEHIWKTIKLKLPPEAMPAAQEFIWLVLQRRLLLARVDNVIDELPEATRRTKNRAKRFLQENRFGRLSLETGLLAEAKERRAQRVGQKGGGRRLFIVGWREKFKELCGQPLDEIASALTQIAYGGEAPSISAVRSTERPTTQAGRDIRPSK